MTVGMTRYFIRTKGFEDPDALYLEAKMAGIVVLVKKNGKRLHMRGWSLAGCLIQCKGRGLREISQSEAEALRSGGKVELASEKFSKAEDSPPRRAIGETGSQKSEARKELIKQ